MPSNVLHVKVRVANGKPTCTPELVDVTADNTLISFELKSDDYHFPDTGAVVVANGGSDFPYPAWTVKPTQAAVLDLDLIEGDFSYTVTVVHNQSGAVLTVDPTIKNTPP
jgi:hypothetical protein